MKYIKVTVASNGDHYDEDVVSVNPIQLRKFVNTFKEEAERLQELYPSGHFESIKCWFAAYENEEDKIAHMWVHISNCDAVSLEVEYDYGDGSYWGRVETEPIWKTMSQILFAEAIAKGLDKDNDYSCEAFFIDRKHSLVVTAQRAGDTVEWSARSHGQDDAGLKTFVTTG